MRPSQHPRATLYQFLFIFSSSGAQSYSLRSVSGGPPPRYLITSYHSAFFQLNLWHFNREESKPFHPYSFVFSRCHSVEHVANCCIFFKQSLTFWENGKQVRMRCSSLGLTEALKRGTATTEFRRDGAYHPKSYPPDFFAFVTHWSFRLKLHSTGCLRSLTLISAFITKRPSLCAFVTPSGFHEQWVLPALSATSRALLRLIDTRFCCSQYLVHLN